jgi:acetyltransferase-like isoleucine patch superfamily enzyme
VATAGRANRGWDAARPRTVAFAEQIARNIVAPLVLAYRLRLVSFKTAGNALSVVPGGAGILIRRAWYGATLASCGKRLKVLFGAAITDPRSCIGDDCLIGELNRVGFVEIGPKFMSSHGVCIVSGRHQHGYEKTEVAMRDQPATARRIKIGEDVWVGAGAAIGADVAAHSVVGMGAAITRTFDEWKILGGVPGKVIGERR